MSTTDSRRWILERENGLSGKKTIIENGLSVRNHFFWHSEGQVSRQLIFQSLAESHKVPLIEHYGRVSLGFFQAGIEWILTSIEFISAFISAFNLMAINPSLIMAAQFGTSKPSLSSSYPLWPNWKPYDPKTTKHQYQTKDRLLLKDPTKSRFEPSHFANQLNLWFEPFHWWRQRPF